MAMRCAVAGAKSGPLMLAGIAASYTYSITS